MRRFTVFCLGFLGATAIGALGQTESRTFKADTYCNTKYDFCVAYPVGMLLADPGTESVDGRRFYSRDGRASASVWGFYNVLDTTLKIEYREAGRSDSSTRKVVTYKLLKDDYFVVSGFLGPYIFYRKMVYKDGVFKNLLIEYPRDQRQYYDPIAAAMAVTFPK